MLSRDFIYEPARLVYALEEMSDEDLALELYCTRLFSNSFDADGHLDVCSYKPQLFYYCEWIEQYLLQEAARRYVEKVLGSDCYYLVMNDD